MLDHMELSIEIYWIKEIMYLKIIDVLEDYYITLHCSIWE